MWTKNLHFSANCKDGLTGHKTDTLVLIERLLYFCIWSIYQSFLRKRRQNVKNRITYLFQSHSIQNDLKCLVNITITITMSWLFFGGITTFNKSKIQLCLTLQIIYQHQITLSQTVHQFIFPFKQYTPKMTYNTFCQNLREEFTLFSALGGAKRKHKNKITKKRNCEKVEFKKACRQQ